MPGKEQEHILQQKNVKNSKLIQNTSTFRTTPKLNLFMA